MSKRTNKIAGERERRDQGSCLDHRNQGTQNRLMMGGRHARLIASTAATASGQKADPCYADFFFAFGLVAFGITGASGVPSIEDRRPEVNV